MDKQTQFPNKNTHKKFYYKNSLRDTFEQTDMIDMF